MIDDKALLQVEEETHARAVRRDDSLQHHAGQPLQAGGH